VFTADSRSALPGFRVRRFFDSRFTVYGLWRMVYGLQLGFSGCRILGETFSELMIYG